MAKRPSIRDTEAAAPSADRYFTPDPEPATPEPVAAAPKWEEMNRRWTFHAPVDVLNAVEAEAMRLGRSKSGVVVAILRDALRVPDTRGPGRP